MPWSLDDWTRTNEQAMLRSECDCREYRLIELQNGLRAMLIRGSEPGAIFKQKQEGIDSPSLSFSPNAADKGGSALFTEKMAAACLTVRCGSLQDPDYMGGLAHYLEHMLFLGSEKYPQENEYSKFISEHGGSCNAYTGADTTCFYFEITQAAFRHALDIFANFFVAPLLRADALDRELRAVDSEFQLNAASDSSRTCEVLARQAGNHPLGRFCWGNTLSLKEMPAKLGLDVREELLKFYNTFYSASVMTLAVQSQNSLDDLEKFVRESFDLVPRRHRAKISYPAGLPFHDNAEFFRLFKIVPIQQRTSLIFRWVLPPQRKHYKEKAFSYLSYAICHEGRNGILDHLRERQWALEISPSVDDDQGICAILSLDVLLTDLGVENIAEVTRFVHQYLNVLRKKGPQRWMWDELKRLADIRFRFKDEEGAGSYVQTISQAMQLYDEEHYLCAGALYFEYNEERLRDLLKLMTPDKCNIVYLHHDLQNEAASFEHWEPWMGISYNIEEFPESWVQLWDADDDEAFQQNLCLPEANQYIATDLSLRSDDDSISPPFPVVVKERKNLKLWFRKDDKFLRPTVYISLLFATNLLDATCRRAICIDLVTNVFALLMAHVTTYAERASLYHHLSGSEMGLQLLFSGFYDKMPLFVSLITDRLLALTCSTELFDAVKTDLRKNYCDSIVQNDDFAFDLLCTIVDPSFYSAHRRLADLPLVTRRELLRSMRELFANAFVEAYVHGNATSSDAKRIVNKVVKRLAAKPTGKPQPRIHALIDGQVYVRALSVNAESTSSYITNYYVYGPSSFYEETLMTLFVMFMEERCFNQLRTQDQLSYVASCSLFARYRVIGFRISVSPTADTFSLSEADSKIENFVTQMVTVVEQLSMDEFHTVRQALIRQKSCADLSMADEVCRNWAEIAEFAYIFDCLQLEIRFLRELELERFREWALKVIPRNPYERSKLSVQVVGFGRAALEECQDGAQIWAQHCSADRSPNRSSDHVPQLRLLVPTCRDERRYVTDLDHYLSKLDFYPPTRRDPIAEVHW